jgi:hypothetical protein
MNMETLLAAIAAKKAELDQRGSAPLQPSR